MQLASTSSRDLIKHLLVRSQQLAGGIYSVNLQVREPGLRLSSSQALQHPWLETRVGEEGPARSIMLQLETGWMKKCLARRR